MASSQEMFLDGTQSWAYTLGVTALVLDLTLLPFLCILLWKRRDFFPLNSTPSFLLLSTQIGASLFVVSLLQSIVSPSLPCWLHFFISLGDYFPFFCGTALQLFRTWYVFNVQQSISQKKRNWFSKHSSLVSDANLKKILFGCGLFLGLLPLIQLSTRSKEALNGPMIGETCLRFSSAAESGFASACWYLIIIANVLFSFLMRNIDDAFNLRENWRNIAYFFLMGTPLNAMAANLSDGLNEDVRFNAYALGQFAYVGAAFSYIWFASLSPIQQSFAKEWQEKREREAFAAHQKKHDRGGRGAAERDADDGNELTLVLTTAELKAALLRTEILPQFKQYLIREFCCENILFVQAVERLRGLGKKRVNETERQKESQQIIEDFIRENAPFELNISQNLRRSILTKWEEDALRQGRGEKKSSGETEQEADIGIFLPAEEEVYRMMLDPYNRFIRSFLLGHTFGGGRRDSTIVGRSGSSARIIPGK